MAGGWGGDVSAINTKLRAVQGGHIAFWCPGCGHAHIYYVGPGSGPRWQYNGNPDRPTFTPSLLNRTGRAVDPAFVPEPGDPPEICHLFLTDGRLQFCGDSTHALAGQTVDLPDWPKSDA